MIMKYIHYIILGLTLTLFSCERTDLDIYDGDSGIYFDTFEMRLDTIDVAWGFKNSEVLEQSITIQVNLIGDVKDYDRKFNIAIEPEVEQSFQALEGVDYVKFPTEYVIPKGMASTKIQIDLLRNPELKERQRRLNIKLIETDELKFIYSRKAANTEGEIRALDTQRIIKMTENFPIPRWWLVYGQKYFGNWTATKSILICDLMDIDRELWVSQIYSQENFTEGFLRYAGVYVHRWLQEQNPKILDEDDKPMEMGPYSKR